MKTKFLEELARLCEKHDTTIVADGDIIHMGGIKALKVSSGVYVIERKAIEHGAHHSGSPKWCVTQVIKGVKASVKKVKKGKKK